LPWMALMVGSWNPVFLWSNFGNDVKVNRMSFYLLPDGKVVSMNQIAVKSIKNQTSPSRPGPIILQLLSSANKSFTSRTPCPRDINASALKHSPLARPSPTCDCHWSLLSSTNKLSGTTLYWICLVF
jgi:hypothetical protein